MTDRLLGHLTSEEAGAAAARGAVILIPIGAFEQHGPHLPLDVDIHIAQAVAQGVARRLPDAYLAPPLTWGLSANHLAFPGRLSLSATTMTALVHDVVGSLIHHGFRRMVLVNYHMSNRALVSLACRQIGQEHGVAPAHVFVSDFAAEVFTAHRRSELGGELHAGEFETSVEMHLRPELVRLDRAVVNVVDPERHFGSSRAQADMFAGGMVQTGFDFRAAAPDGVLGDPSVASADLGERLLEAMVSGITEVVSDLKFD